MKKVLVIFGTRPEAIKMCPLVLELKKSEKLETLVCVTGQHKEMLKQVLDIFKVVPDYDMAIMKKGQDLTDVTTAILTGMREILRKEKPDMVLVMFQFFFSFIRNDCICRIAGCILSADSGRTCGSGTSNL